MDATEIYRHHPERYDELVRAEDHRAHLGGAIGSVARLPGATVVEVGAGTGRLTRILLAAGAARVVASDRAPAMLARARATLASPGHRASFYLADAVALPLRSGVADVGIAGWVFGHFRQWLPGRWRESVGAAVDELTRAVRSGGAVVVVETLGTGFETPRAPNPGLAEYYAWLERERGFACRAIRTDYRFESVEEAARVTGFFFGEAFAETVRANRWAIVPECTGIWHRAI